MKLHHFLLAFLFTAIALAGQAVNFNHGEISNLTGNSTFSQPGPNDVVLKYDDMMSGPAPNDMYAGLTAQADLTAYTESGDTSSAVDGKVAMIRMSTVKQHVGELAGQRLFDVIHDALLKMCSYERGRLGCHPNMPGAATPYGQNQLEPGKKFYNRVWIQDVPYKSDQGSYKTNAWVTITAKAIFREDKYPGLGAATYKMAAGVYKQATEVVRNGLLRNCYSESFDKMSRPYVFCNVPKHVLIALPVHKGHVIESWLSVTVEFNGNTRYGDFHCSTSIPEVSDFWEYAVYPEVAKSMGTSASDWAETKLCTECWDDDEPFGLKTWRNHHACENIGWK